MSCQFTAENQELISSVASIGAGRLWSACGWFKDISSPGGTNAGVISLGNWDASKANGYIAKIGSTMIIGAYTGSFPNATFALFSISAATWYFVGMTRNGSNLRGYIWGADGSLIGSTLCFSNVGTAACTEIRIGNTFFDMEELIGAVMAMKFWDGVELTQAQFEQEQFYLDPVHAIESGKGWYPIYRAAFGGRDLSGRGVDLGGNPQAYADQPPLSLYRGHAGAVILKPPPIYVADPYDYQLTVREEAYELEIEDAAYDLTVPDEAYQVQIGSEDFEVEVG